MLELANICHTIQNICCKYTMIYQYFRMKTGSFATNVKTKEMLSRKMFWSILQIQSFSVAIFCYCILKTIQVIIYNLKSERNVSLMKWKLSFAEKLVFTKKYFMFITSQINVLSFYDKSRQLLRKIYAPLLIDTL